MRPRKYSDEFVAQVMAKFDSGMNVRQVARHLRIPTGTVEHWYVSWRRSKGMTQSRYNFISVKEDAERLFKQVPTDTRDLTGRMLGDPLPGRSALHARQRAGA